MFDFTILEQSKQFFEYEPILLLDGLPDSLGSELIFIFLDHAY